MCVYLYVSLLIEISELLREFMKSLVLAVANLFPMETKLFKFPIPMEIIKNKTNEGGVATKILCAFRMTEGPATHSNSEVLDVYQRGHLFL